MAHGLEPKTKKYEKNIYDFNGIDDIMFYPMQASARRRRGKYRKKS